MDLSFLGQSSKQLVCSRSSQEKQNQVSFNYIDYINKKEEASSVSLLLESIKHKQSQRLKLREIIAKQDQFAQLTDRCRILERENEKAKDKVEACQRENKALNSRLQLLQKDIEATTFNHRQNLSAVKTQSNQLQEQMKGTIRSLQVQNQQLKNNIKSQTNRHEIALNRLHLEAEQTKKELQAKIVIKEKQLVKVEKALQDKKKQMVLSLNEKDLQIQMVQQRRAELQQKINTLNEKLTQYEQQIYLLQSKTNELQAEYESELARFRDETERRGKAHEDDANLNKVTLDCIEQAVKALIREFSLKDSECIDLHVRLDDIRMQLKQRFSQSKSKQEWSKVIGQVQRYRSLELELRSRVNILQEELDFTKMNNTKNQNVAELIKQHLDSHQQTLIDYKQDKINNFHSQQKSKKAILPQPTALHQQIQALIAQNKHHQHPDISSFRRTTTSELKNYRKNNHMPDGYEKRSNPSKMHYKSSPKQDLTRAQHFANNSQRHPISQLDQNQFLTMKNELTSKKKSLVYLLYKGEQHKEPALPSETKKEYKKQNSYNQKQRSYSMGELVRKRCQQHLL